MIDPENPEDVQATPIQYIWFQPSSGKYYFSDETEGLNGPYDTSELAVAALDAYASWLNTPPTSAVNKVANLPQSTVKYYGG